jgi:hypothetical protein
MTTTLMRLWRSVIYLIERTEQVAYYLPRSLLRSWPFAGVNSRIARRWGWVTRKVWAMTGNAHPRKIRAQFYGCKPTSLSLLDPLDGKVNWRIRTAP